MKLFAKGWDSCKLCSRTGPSSQCSLGVKFSQMPSCPVTGPDFLPARLESRPHQPHRTLSPLLSYVSWALAKLCLVLGHPHITPKQRHLAQEKRRRPARGGSLEQACRGRSSRTAFTGSWLLICKVGWELRTGKGPSSSDVPWDQPGPGLRPPPLPILSAS